MTNHSAIPQVVTLGLLCSVALWHPVTPRAQEATPTPLDLAACVEKALLASHSLQARSAQADSATAKAAQARDARLPSLNASGSYTHSSEVDGGTISLGSQTITLPSPLQDATVLRLQASQLIFSGGRVAAGIAGADANLQASRAELKAERSRVASMAERSYWGLYLAQASYDSAAERLRAITRHLQDASRRLDQGSATKSEILAWEQRKVQAELGARQAKSKTIEASATLAILLGLPWDSELQAAPPPADQAENQALGSDPKGALEGLDEKLAAGRANRADLAAAAARIEASKAAVSLARSAFYPSLFVSGSFSYADPNPKTFPQTEGFDTLWDLGIGVSMDIGALPLNRQKVKDSQGNLRSAQAQAQAIAEAADLEVIKAVLALDDAEAKIAAATAAVSLAEENLRSEKDRADAGFATEAEVADAESSLLDAKLTKISAGVGRALAAATLRDAVGGSAEEILSGGAGSQTSTVKE